MDSRLHVRRPVDLAAVISYPQVGIFSVRTRNVSVGGMLVETGAVSLPRGEDINVCFHFEQGETDCLCSTQAQVVHATVSGAGLKFLALDTDSREALNGLLRAADPAF